jgi:geranylgeranyl pyrophosphate synthase
VSATGVAPFEEVLESAGPGVRAALRDAERLLSEISGSHGPLLARAAGDTLAAGGKRLRPLLVLICGEAANGAGREPLVRAGTAVELVHMATLVHDDVVDGAKLRRGRPTVYASAGRETATATGDFLFSRAFALLERNGDRRQVRALAGACLALARGELVQREDAYARSIGVERYLYRCELKTGSLFTAACSLGALAAGADDAPADALGRFGQRMGLAFQILDDVLDVAGPMERTGKQRGTDLLEGTTTLPLILAAESDARLAGLDLRGVRSRAEAEEICERIAATDALDESRRRAAILVTEAKQEIETALDPDLTELLSLVADRVVGRYS